MTLAPKPGIHNYCRVCMGYRHYTVGNSTDWEDERDCISCNGTGIRATEGQAS